MITEKEMKEKEMNGKLKKATKKFLDVKGYDFVTWLFDNVCVFIDEDVVVICEIYTDKCHATRESFEQYIAHFFNDIVDVSEYDCMPIRFDTIYFNILGDNRAIIRHHIKADDEFDSDGRWCE